MKLTGSARETCIRGKAEGEHGGSEAITVFKNIREVKIIDAACYLNGFTGVEFNGNLKVATPF